MTQPEWHRVDGAWVRKTAGVLDPPPVAEANWSAHIPGRIQVGIANTDASSTNLTYAQAVSFSGPVYERRKFNSGWVTASYINNWLNTTAASGQLAWLSWKVPGTDWAGVANGNYDAGLDIIAERASSRSEKWIASIHHEPNNDGSLSAWADMQEYVSDYLAPVKDKVCFAAICNGFFWAPHNVLTSNINQAFPSSLISTFNANDGMICADTYDGAPNDRTDAVLQSFLDWCRTKGVRSAGIGEWACDLPDTVRRFWNVCVDNNDILGVINYYNSTIGLGRILVPSNYKAPNSAFNGDANSQGRLNYFVQILEDSTSTSPAGIP